MGLFDRFRPTKIEAQLNPPLMTDSFNYFLPIAVTAVGREEAISVPAVARCRNLIAGTIATFPLELYKDIKNAAGDVKDVLDDLKKQFAAKPNPSNEEKRQYNEEVQRVQTIAKTDPGDAFTDIGEQLGKFMDAYDAIIKLFLKEEMESKKVYKGDESIGRRALRRVLIRSKALGAICRVF